MIFDQISDELKRIKRYSNFISIVWVIVVSLSLFWNIYSISTHEEDIAKSNARAYFEKDLQFRNWMIEHGDMYAPINEKNKAVPNLAHIPNRNIKLPSGVTLTLINPQYMISLLQEDCNKSNQIICNITSLKPIREENIPDEWERKALVDFENGVREVSEFSSINGEEYLRHMEPLITEKCCLKCLEIQGYKVGDIRGGISVSVPMKPILENSRKGRNRIIAIHFLLMFIGFIGIRTTGARFSKKTLANQKIKEKLLEKDERLKLALATTNAGVWDWNIQTGKVFLDERWGEILGYTLAELEPTTIETWNSLIHPDDLPELDLLLEKHYASELEHYEYETRMKHKNGVWIWVKISGKVIERDKKNIPIRMVGVINDITKRKISEKIISNANTQIISILNSIDANIYVADMETYELLFVNKTLVNLVGNITGKLCWQVLQKNQTGPCDFCTNNKIVTKDGKPGKPYTWEFKNTITNKWYIINDRAIKWHDGRIVRLEIATDINASKRTKEALKESEKRFRTTFKNAIDPIIIAEISKTHIPIICDINSAVTKIIGYTKKEIIGKPMGIIFPNEKEDILLERARKILSGEQLNIELLQTKKDGSHFPIELSAKRIQINHKYYIYIIERDISERKKWEKEILEAQQKLKEENANKDKFFSIISHDLKAPFGALLGIEQYLEENFDDLENDEKKELIHIARTSATNIYNLLEGLLEWSLAKSGKLDFTPSIINLNDVSLQVFQILSQNAKNKNITIVNSIKDNSTAYADEKMYRTILRNLLANAIKFTSEEGEIIVSSKIAKNNIEITVSDNGIGIKEEDVGKLFKIEVHHTTLGTKKESGTGVGLILCDELVKKNGGKIWVDSKFSKGSSFKFTLPLTKM